MIAPPRGETSDTEQAYTHTTGTNFKCARPDK